MRSVPSSGRWTRTRRSNIVSSTLLRTMNTRSSGVPAATIRSARPRLDGDDGRGPTAECKFPRIAKATAHKEIRISRIEIVVAIQAADLIDRGNSGRPRHAQGGAGDIMRVVRVDDVRPEPRDDAAQLISE